jgi:hypothetical protein
MDADFSIELGRDDPALDFPWSDLGGKFAYFDLKRHPELLTSISEATAFPELAEFLRTVNSPKSTVESAKCDAWTTDEISAEEEIFGASSKCASYVDLVFSGLEQRRSFPLHELFARRLVELLRRTPETPSGMELCVRRCYFRDEAGISDGFYWTLYVNGYGDDAARARQNWGIALKLVGNAVLQLSTVGLA